MNVPVVTVEAFFQRHAESLQLKLEGKQIGFDRRIREPTINRPGLAWPDSIPISLKNASRFSARQNNLPQEFVGPPTACAIRRTLLAKDPVLVASRGFHLAPKLLSIAESAGIAVFRTPMITMKFINAATIALELDFSPR